MPVSNIKDVTLNKHINCKQKKNVEIVYVEKKNKKQQQQKSDFGINTNILL